MPNAGFQALVSVSSTSGGVFSEIGGLNDASIQRVREMLDTTNFKGAAADPSRTRIYGLKDTSLSISGDYEPDDTSGQVVLMDAHDNGTSVFLQFLPDRTNGWQAEFLVESFDVSTTVDGKAEFSASLQATGPATRVP